MKKFLTTKLAKILFLVLAVAMAGVYVFMLVRPISVGMTYKNETETSISTTQTEVTVLNSKKMKIKTTTNSNFTGVTTSENEYYICSEGGKVAIVGALNDEMYEAMTDTEEERENLVKLATYEFNAFAMQGPMGEYKCTGAVVFAIVGGIIELILVGFVIATFTIKPSKKKRK